MPIAPGSFPPCPGSITTVPLTVVKRIALVCKADLILDKYVEKIDSKSTTIFVYLGALSMFLINTISWILADFDSYPIEDSIYARISLMWAYITTIPITLNLFFILVAIIYFTRSIKHLETYVEIEKIDLALDNTRSIIPFLLS